MPPTKPIEKTLLPMTSSPAVSPFSCRQYISLPERPVVTVAGRAAAARGPDGRAVPAGAPAREIACPAPPMALPRIRSSREQPPLVAVLGGAGAMGRAVVFDLARAGHPVRILESDRAAARRAARRYGGRTCEVESADAMDPAALALKLQGAAALVNCAPYRL